MKKNRVRWFVGLSNGNMVHEGVGDFEVVGNELSPWSRLLQMVVENNLKITSLGLVTDSGQTFNLPSLGSHPKFRPFYSANMPIDYRMFRTVAMALNKKGGKIREDRYAVIEAVYEDRRLQIWVSENDPRNCWTLTL